MTRWRARGGGAPVAAPEAWPAVRGCHAAKEAGVDACTFEIKAAAGAAMEGPPEL
jgi:hypothetical protein